MHRCLPALLMVVALTSCSDGDDGGAGIVVTTSILGDVVTELVGDLVEVTTVMPRGVAPHDFQASARDAAAMREAELLVVNGAGFEEGLLEVVDAAADDGVPVHEAIATVDAIGDDPHFFTDPARMVQAAEGIVDAVAEHVDVDEAALRERAAGYLDELRALDAQVEETLAPVPDPQRILVTNHEVFGYFAERYGFEVVGTVIPSTTTGGSAAAGDLAALIEVIRTEGVPAVFADTSSPADLARALAADAGDIEVVELFSESLGDDGSGGETYLDMMRTNATRITEALT